MILMAVDPIEEEGATNHETEGQIRIMKGAENIKDLLQNLNQKPRPRKRPNPYKKSGVEKYKEYEYEGAIEDFKKALEIDPKDIPTHFNIACAYSLTEG